MATGVGDEIAEAIRVRAGEIEEMGAYIGFYEWTVFGVCFGMRVEMLFGSHIVDVTGVFAPGVAFQPAGVARVCAVRVGSGGRLLSARPSALGHIPRVNHFVIGMRAAAEDGARVPDMPPVEEEGAASVPRAATARADALLVHWALLPTAAQGDCGIDTMTHFLRRDREPSSWAVLRKELAAFMRQHADEAEWHEIFAACQETDLPPPSARSLDARAGGLGPPALPEASSPTPPPKGTPPSGLADAEAAPQPEASATSTPSSDATGGAVSLVPWAAKGVPSFAAWMSSRAPGELMRMTESLEAFREAELEWVALLGDGEASGQRPRRKHQATKVSYKLATGFAYLEWRGGDGLKACACHFWCPHGAFIFGALMERVRLCRGVPVDKACLRREGAEKGAGAACLLHPHGADAKARVG